MPYDMNEHRHRFGVWTAARAVARGFASTRRVRTAIEATTLKEIASAPEAWPSTPDAVDELHRVWAHVLIADFARHGVRASYGQAAKVIALYLKTTVILRDDQDHPFQALAHPPIDGQVLRGLAREPGFETEHRAVWRSAKWTRLDETAYFALLGTLRRAGLERPAFWQAESHWLPDDQ